MTKYIFYITLIVVLLPSCITPFEFEGETYDKVLVVDGSLTDVEGVHKVKLSYSYRVNSGEEELISGAQVYVEGSNGSLISFNQSGPGIYVTNDGIKGIPGIDYSLHIIIDGNKYSTKPIELKTSPPIDSIYDKYTVISSDVAGEQIGGIQFLIDTHDDSGVSKWYRYEWEETWMIRVPFPTQFYYDFELDEFQFQTEDKGTCYSSGKSNTLTIGSSVTNTLNRVIEQPVRFIPATLPQLRSRYSILVKQYAIDQDAFLFYRKIKESNESGGFLFDRQLGSIPGNIISEADPKEVVLGYFEVAGVSEKREFFNPSDLQPPFRPPGYQYDCSFSELILTTNDSIPYYLDLNAYLEIVTISLVGDDPAILARRECANCTWFSTNVKPEYWKD